MADTGIPGEGAKTTSSCPGCGADLLRGDSVRERAWSEGYSVRTGHAGGPAGGGETEFEDDRIGRDKSQHVSVSYDCVACGLSLDKHFGGF